jgi:hypothetical protein
MLLEDFAGQRSLPRELVRGNDWPTRESGSGSTVDLLKGSFIKYETILGLGHKRVLGGIVASFEGRCHLN